MATLTQTQKFTIARMAAAQKRDEIIERLMPRRCMIVSVGLVLAGLGIPTGMLVHLLPVSLLLGFASVILIGTGGVLVLIYRGEI